MSVQGQEYALKGKGFEELFSPPKAKRVVPPATVRSMFSEPAVPLRSAEVLASKLEGPPEPVLLVFRNLDYRSGQWGNGNTRVVIDSFGWEVPLGKEGKVKMLTPACYNISPACRETMTIGIAFKWRLR